jgi:hypothetical protein
MTRASRRAYCPLSMGEWQTNAAFVVQFRENTDIEAGRLEGKVEHIASYEALRFHSAEELFAFIARVLTDVRNADRR